MREVEAIDEQGGVLEAVVAIAILKQFDLPRGSAESG